MNAKDPDVQMKEPTAPTSAPVEDPRTRAAARAAQLREHWQGDSPDTEDKFYIDPAIVPEGWSYEYRRITVLNAPDPAYAVALARAGWEPVLTERHPELMPDGYDPQKQITRDGMGLFERPMEITIAARERELRAARAQVRAKEEQLHGPIPGVTLSHTKDDGTKALPNAGARRSYSPMKVTE